MEPVFGSPRSSAVTPVRCSVAADDVARLTSLLCHARVGSVPAVVWISCLPPKKKRPRNYFTQTALEERRSIFKSIKAREDGVEMDWNWAGGEGVRCWMYVFLACQMSKLNLRDGSHFSSSRSSLWWIHPVVHNCTVGKWISGDWIHPNASLCFGNLSNYWQLPVALLALATSPSSPLKTTCYLTPWERRGGDELRAV